MDDPSTPVEPILWTIPFVDLASLDEDGYYTTLEICDDKCHNPVHSFRPERRHHLIHRNLVEIAMKNHWWDYVWEEN